MLLTRASHHQNARLPPPLRGRVGEGGRSTTPLIAQTRTTFSAFFESTRAAQRPPTPPREGAGSRYEFAQ